MFFSYFHLSFVFFTSENNLFSKDLYIMNTNEDNNNKIELKDMSTTVEENGKTELDTSNVSDIRESIFVEQKRDLKEGIGKRFFDIVFNPIYITTCLGTTTLMFISTGVVFWAPNYAENVLGGDHDQVLAVFVTVTITGPVLGVILGGAIVQKLVGGYEDKHASSISLTFALLAFMCSLPIKKIENVYSFGFCLWTVLFFGGAVIPNVQGIMISSLKPDLRAAGNSISMIMQCILGYIPAPFIYGFIYNLNKDTDKKAAFAFILWYSVVGVILFSLSLYYRFQLFEKLEKQQKEFDEVNRQFGISEIKEIKDKENTLIQISRLDISFEK